MSAIMVKKFINTGRIFAPGMVFMFD